MNKSLAAAALGGIGGGLLIVSALWAQRAPSSSSPPSGVALVDVASISLNSESIRILALS